MAELADMQDELIAEIDQRSIYAKPLPFDCTLESLQAFFSSMGGVKAVRMRRRPENKDFKGSVFVEMESSETAAAVSHTALTTILRSRVQITPLIPSELLAK